MAPARPNRVAMDGIPARAGPREGLIRQAERFTDAFGLVLVLVLLTYALASVLANRGWPAVVLAIAVSATSVVAFVSSHARPVVVRRATLVSLLPVALSVVSALFGGRLWLSAASLIAIGLLAVAMATMLRRVLASREVGFRTILGAISFYVALGILFTFAYGTIDRFEDGGFFGSAVHADGGDFVFFSYTTLTTTGYGNLVPAADVGRMVAGLEMMLGQVFLVTLVAGLVSLWRPGQTIRGGGDGGGRSQAG